jgi:tetratricopeptide (TPR) repeat protein
MAAGHSSAPGPFVSPALLSSCPHPDSFVPDLLQELRDAAEALKSDNVSPKVVAAISKAFQKAESALARAAPPRGEHQFQVGDRVVLRELKQRLDLNGCVAIVRSAADDAEVDGRIEISVGAGKSKETLRIKSANMRLDWHAAADAHAASAGHRVMLRIRCSAASGQVCEVVSFDPSNCTVALSEVDRERSADGDAPVHVAAADVVPAAYSDLAREVHQCALKVVLMPGSHMVVAAVNAVLNAVDSCVRFNIRCARDADAASVCVSVLKMLHTGTRSGLALTKIYGQDYRNRTRAYMEMCHSIREELASSNYYDAAIAIMLQCKHIIQEIEGDTSVNFAYLLQHISSLHEKQDRLADAEVGLREAMRILTGRYGHESLQVTETLNNLALVLEKQNQLCDAEAMYKEAIRIKEKLLGRDAVEVASTLNNLALLYFRKFPDRYDEVEAMYKEVMRIEDVNDVSLEAAITFNNLAMLYTKQARFGEAEVLYEKAMRARELAYGHESLIVAKTINNIAMLCEKQGRYDDARANFEECLRIKMTRLGSDSLDVAVTQQSLALLHEKMGLFDEAEAFFKEALRIRELKVGHDSLDVGKTLNFLASLHEKQMRIPDAVDMHKAALRITEAHLGHESIEVAASLNNLALLYYRYYKDRLDEAEAMYKETMRIEELKVGHDSPEVAKTLDNLALLHEKQDRLADAEAVYKEGLRIYELTLGPDAPETVTMRERLSMLNPPVLSDIVSADAHP